MSPVVGARVPPLSISEWTSRHHQLVDRFGTDGRADPLLATLLQVPEIVEGVMPLTCYLGKASTLAPEQRLLLVLRTCCLELSHRWTRRQCTGRGRQVTVPGSLRSQRGHRRLRITPDGATRRLSTAPLSACSPGLLWTARTEPEGD